MPQPAIVRQIDHVLLTTDRATELFSLLSGTLQLPVAWAWSDYGSFGSGGIALGNVNLEVLQIRPSPTGTTAVGFTGLALEPHPLRISLAELDARRILRGSPAPFRSWRWDRFLSILWTTVALPSVSSDALEVFLCDYTHDVPERRQRLLVELEARRGGPLSVRSVREIVIGARDLTRVEADWRALLPPLRLSDDGAWQPGDGPAIRVVAAERDEIKAVIVEVASLDQARSFLRQHDLLGSDGAASIVMAAPRFPGFKLTLVESSPVEP